MRGRIGWLLGGVVALGIAARMLFVFHQPFTNDEGSYLYDARTLLEGRLPAGDVLTKAPAVAGLLMSSVWLTGGSLFAARFVSVTASVLMVVPLALFGRRLFGRAAGLLTGAFWLLGAAPVAFASFGQTEAVAGLFGISALALGARALNVGAPKIASVGQRSQFLSAVLAGLAFALAFASRKTSIALLVPGLLLLMGSSLSSRSKRQLVFGSLLGCSFVLIPWIVWVRRLYGLAGVREAIGLGYAEILTGHVRDPASVPAWVADPWWALGIGLRTAGPFLFIALFGIRAWLRGGIRGMRSSPFLLPLAWCAVLGLLYAAWPTLLPDYLPEFFPPMLLVAGAGMIRVSRSIGGRGRAALAALLVVWNAAVLLRIYQSPWIGMFTARAVQEAAVEVTRLVPRDEPLFTAALLVPYLSGHRVPFDIAHPFWYRYVFVSPEVLRTFLPSLEEVDATVRSRVRWALVEHFTDYAYLRHTSDLLSYVWTRFHLVASVPNSTGFRNNTLLLWERNE